VARLDLDKFLTAPPLPQDPAEILTRLNPLHASDFLLAHACAYGHPGAWEHFILQFRPALIRAATAIVGNLGATPAQDFADALYAELYDLRTKTGSTRPDTGIRRSPLSSYQGRGSLLGWLRTMLAQRHVDQHRKTWREQSVQSIDDLRHPIPEPAQPHQPPALPGTAVSPLTLSRALEQAIRKRSSEEKFLLAAYYLDQQTLLQIAHLLRVHEATISRRLHRIQEDLRQDTLASLQSLGLSARAAQEALGTDPRDLEQFTSNLRNLLQTSASQPFSEKPRP
jgi:RNA polymerase sigma-70 factor (ECF subfamily)